MEHLGDALGGGRDLGRAVRHLAHQAKVEGRLAPVPGDLQHVVLLRPHRPGAHPLGPLGQSGHVGRQPVGGSHHHGLGPAAGKGRADQGEGVGAANVSHRGEHAQQLGDVAEAGEATGEAIGGAVGCQLQGGEGAPEGGRPGIEMGHPGPLQRFGLEVGLHHVHLGQAVGDGRGGGEGGHPGPVATSQVVQLEFQVLCPHRAGPADSLDAGGELSVFIGLCLVNFTAPSGRRSAKEADHRLAECDGHVGDVRPSRSSLNVPG